MSFETIVGILLSALLPQIFERIQLKKGVLLSKIAKLLMIIAVFIGVFFLLELPSLKAVYESFIQDIKVRVVLLVILGILLVIFYSEKSNEDYCTYNQLVNRIIKFTEKATANSILYILCGDMDKAWDFKYGEPKEFRQLKEISEQVQEIRILCKHGMAEDLVDEIRNDTFDVDKIVEDTRSNREQLERIVKFKRELGGKCHFRFYERDKDDFSNLRARVIRADWGMEALIYYNSRITSKPFIKNIRKYFPKLANFIEERTDYSYKYCDFSGTVHSFQQQHYIELCEMKWNSCDKELAAQIESYCLEYISRKEGNAIKGMPMIKKIAFVYAKTYEVAHFKEKRKEFPPFGVMYLAAMVKEHCQDWIPSIIAIEEGNCCIDIEKYDIIAFSVISAYTVPLFEQCMEDIFTQKSDASKNKRRCLCIAGGYQAELETEKWLRKGLVDYVLNGEGEKTIVSLIGKYCKNPKTVKTIEGISYLEAGTIIKKEKTSGCISLDEIPFPMRELLPEEDYIMQDRLAGTSYKMVHVLFSRGCQNNCYYCGVPKGKENNVVRYRSPQNIVKELEELKVKGIEGFSIIDDCFLTDQEKAIEIIEAVSEVGLKWSLAARVDQINDEIVHKLKKANCLEIKFGLETGSDIILQKMNKKCTVDDARRAIELVRSYNINVKAFIITGLPFEDKNTNEETKKFLGDMGIQNINRISLLRFVPLPGSYIYNHPEKFGLKANFKQEISYKSYRLYDETDNWWTDDNAYALRNEIYKDIRDFMLTIWKDI